MIKEQISKILNNEKYESDKFKSKNSLINQLYKSESNLNHLDPEELYWLTQYSKEKITHITNKSDRPYIDIDPVKSKTILESEDIEPEGIPESYLQDLQNKKLETKEDYIEEYFKCKTSFEYFCLNYIKIELPGGDVPFTWYKPQRRLAHFLLRENYIISLKSRQIGISTLIQAYIAWLFMFWNNLVAGVVSKDGPEATDFARKTRDMIDKLPRWLKPKYVKKTEQSFILENGCKLYAVTVNPKAPDKTLRGKTITLLVLDEAAFCSKIDKAFIAISPALSKAQQHAAKLGIPYATIILSTPNKTTGLGKWYYEQWRQALSGESIFFPVKCHWREIEEFRNDPDWYNTQCALLNYNELNIQQELELKFVADDSAFLPNETVLKLQENTYNVNYSKIKMEGGELWEFEDYNPNRFHIVGVDTSSGASNDYSAIVIFDYETMNQVADYKGKLPVLRFARLVYKIMKKYRGLYIIENNSYGKTIIEFIQETKESNQLYRTIKDDKNKRTKLFVKGTHSSPKVEYGLSTNVKTRPLIIDSLFSFVKDFPETIKSPRLTLELIGLEQKNGKVEGSPDDLALAASFCYYIRYYDPPTGVITSKESVEDIKEILDMNNYSTNNNRFGSNKIDSDTNGFSFTEFKNIFY